MCKLTLSTSPYPNLRPLAPLDLGRANATTIPDKISVF